MEVISCYYLNIFNKNNTCSLFPNYYGCVNGIAKEYIFDITEDYEYINNEEWFLEKENKLYELIKDNSLEDFKSYL